MFLFGRKENKADGGKKPKKGIWIEEDEFYFFCSECGHYVEDHEAFSLRRCPKCGAEMKI